MDITVVDASGRRTEDATVPSNVAARRITAKLAEVMGHPSSGEDGNPLEYDFHHVRMSRIISDDETLEEAGVRDGDVLRLVFVFACG